jgi:cell division protein FtsB
MARAILGHVGPASDQILAFEIARLRRRVAELETEVADLRARTATLDSGSLDLELHRIAEAHEPALA